MIRRMSDSFIRFLDYSKYIFFFAIYYIVFFSSLDAQGYLCEGVHARVRDAKVCDGISRQTEYVSLFLPLTLSWCLDPFQRFALF